MLRIRSQLVNRVEEREIDYLRKEGSDPNYCSSELIQKNITKKMRTQGPALR